MPPKRRHDIDTSLLDTFRGGDEPATPDPQPSPPAAARPSALEAMLAENRKQRGGRPPSLEGTSRSKALRLNVTIDEADRILAAWQAVPYSERAPSLSAFMLDAVFNKVRRVEKTYNNGEPFQALTKPPPRTRRTLGT